MNSSEEKKANVWFKSLLEAWPGDQVLISICYDKIRDVMIL